MATVTLRELQLNDETEFLSAMNASINLHQRWIRTLKTSEEFNEFYLRCQQDNFKSYVIHNHNNDFVGVFNLSDIARGCFQSAYLGYYSVEAFSGKGYMSAGLKLLLQEIFLNLKLHRIEANIQPENSNSRHLIQSNGFKKEGYSPKYLMIDGAWRDHERWAITYEDWSFIA